MGLIRELMFFGLAVLRGMLILVIMMVSAFFGGYCPMASGVWRWRMCCTGFCLHYLFFS